jgi:hypothetical protein
MTNVVIDASNAGTDGHTRAPPWTQEHAISRRDVSACGRVWTRVPHSSFPRNEGVLGSSPGVGFSGFAGISLMKRWTQSDGPTFTRRLRGVGVRRGL